MQELASKHREPSVLPFAFILLPFATFSSLGSEYNRNVMSPILEYAQ